LVIAKSCIIDGHATSMTSERGEDAVAVGDVVREVWREGRVAEEQHLAGLGIHLGMRGHRASELAAKSYRPTVASVQGTISVGSDDSTSAAASGV
jgi:hypothetical protein